MNIWKGQYLLWYTQFLKIFNRRRLTCTGKFTLMVSLAASSWATTLAGGQNFHLDCVWRDNVIFPKLKWKFCPPAEVVAQLEGAKLTISVNFPVHINLLPLQSLKNWVYHNDLAQKILTLWNIHKRKTQLYTCRLEGCKKWPSYWKPCEGPQISRFLPLAHPLQTCQI